MLLDPHYAYPKAIDVVSPRTGLLLTLEDSVFEETRTRPRSSSEIDDWSVEKIRRVGGDAVKVLAWYRPDADTGVILEHQQEFVARHRPEACRTLRHPLPLRAPRLQLSRRRPAHDRATSNNRPSAPSTSSRAWPPSPDPSYGHRRVQTREPDPGERGFRIRTERTSRAPIGRTQALFDEMNRLSPVPWVMLSPPGRAQDRLPARSHVRLPRRCQWVPRRTGDLVGCPRCVPRTWRPPGAALRVRLACPTSPRSVGWPTKRPCHGTVIAPTDPMVRRLELMPTRRFGTSTRGFVGVSVRRRRNRPTDVRRPIRRGDRSGPPSTSLRVRRASTSLARRTLRMDEDAVRDPPFVEVTEAGADRPRRDPSHVRRLITGRRRHR